MKNKKPIEVDILTFDFYEEMGKLSKEERELSFKYMVDITKLEKEGKIIDENKTILQIINEERLERAKKELKEINKNLAYKGYMKLCLESEIGYLEGKITLEEHREQERIYSNDYSEKRGLLL